MGACLCQQLLWTSPLRLQVAYPLCPCRAAQVGEGRKRMCQVSLSTFPSFPSTTTVKLSDT